MKIFLKIVLFSLVGLTAFKKEGNTPVSKASTCTIPNAAFKDGEKISYKVYYSVAGVFVDAGDATFTTKTTTVNNKPAYHVVGEGRTNSTYDFAFKVRDKYESYIDTVTMQPVKFIRDINEGKYKKYQTATFNKSANTAITNKGVYQIPECVQDVVSAVYYARNIDFSLLRPNDRITFSLFLDNEVHEMYIRYMGKEKIKTQYGTFNAIKIKPLLIKGTLFEGGEKMNVWITDDANKVPVRIESPIIVGKIKVDMMGFSNLRHPLSSLVKKN